MRDQRIRYEEGQRGASPLPPRATPSTPAPSSPPPGAAGSSTAASRGLADAWAEGWRTALAYFNALDRWSAKTGPLPATPANPYDTREP